MNAATSEGGAGMESAGLGIDAGSIPLLRWLAQPSRPAPATVAACVQLGLTDLSHLESPEAARADFAEEVAALASAWGSTHPVRFADFPAALIAVGHKVYLDEPENADEWLAVVHLIDHRPRDWQSRYADEDDFRSAGWLHRSGPSIIEQLRAAGRGPSYARAIFGRALASEVAPDAFGYGPEIRPETFTALVEAGITRGRQLSVYRAAGCTIEDAISLSIDKVSPGAAYYAHREGIPRALWVQEFTGIPDAWVRVRTRRSGTEYVVDHAESDNLLTLGYTIEDLKYLHAHEWDGFSAYEASHGFHPGRGARKLSRETVLRVAESLTHAEIVPWLRDLTTGRRTEFPGKALPPLAFGSPDTLLGHAVDMKSVGVRPAQLSTYRAVGCRSPEDVINAVKAGIDAKTAKHLLSTYGTKRHEWSQARIHSYRDLMKAYKQYLAKESTTAPVDA